MNQARDSLAKAATPLACPEMATIVCPGCGALIEVEIAAPPVIDPRVSPVTDVELVELDLPRKLHNLLRQEGIRTVGELARRSETDLRRLPGLGEASLREVRHALGPLGVTLRTG